jgi:hypothetical protein
LVTGSDSEDNDCDKNDDGDTFFSMLFGSEMKCGVLFMREKKKSLFMRDRDAGFNFIK